MRDELEHELDQLTWTRPDRFVPKPKPSPKPRPAPRPAGPFDWGFIVFLTGYFWSVANPVALVAPGYFAQLIGFWGGFVGFLFFLAVWAGLVMVCHRLGRGILPESAMEPGTETGSGPGSTRLNATLRWWLRDSEALYIAWMAATAALFSAAFILRAMALPDDPAFQVGLLFGLHLVILAAILIGAFLVTLVRPPRPGA